MLHLTRDSECSGMPFLASLYPCYPPWEEHTLGSYWPWNPEAWVLEWESGGVYHNPTPNLRQNHFSQLQMPEWEINFIIIRHWYLGIICHAALSQKKLHGCITPFPFTSFAFPYVSIYPSKFTSSGYPSVRSSQRDWDKLFALFSVSPSELVHIFVLLIIG